LMELRRRAGLGSLLYSPQEATNPKSPSSAARSEKLMSKLSSHFLCRFSCRVGGKAPQWFRIKEVKISPRQSVPPPGPGASEAPFR
jgi:hypothetical protein